MGVSRIMRLTIVICSLFISETFGGISKEEFFYGVFLWLIIILYAITYDYLHWKK